MAEEITPSEYRYSRMTKLGIFFSTLGIVIFVSAFGYGYFQLAQVNLTLANMVSQLETKTTKLQENIHDLNQAFAQLEQIDTNTHAKVMAQEKILAELDATKKGDLNHWHVAESQYLVKLASERMLYTSEPQSALPLLERALQILVNTNEPPIVAIRTALINDIKNLNAQAKVEVGSTYAYINQLDQLIDTLTLPFAPLSTQEKMLPANVPEDLPWWKKGLQHSANILKQVIIVRRNESNTLPVVMPDEKAYLFQNLHAQMENITWGLLHRDPAVYQTSILRALTWVQTYFVQDKPQTQTVIAGLQKLQAINFDTSKIDLSPTLALFDQYLMVKSAPDDQTQ